MYHISSAKENIIAEVPQKIPIYTFSATLGAPALECIFSGTLSSHIFFVTTSTIIILNLYSSTTLQTQRSAGDQALRKLY